LNKKKKYVHTKQFNSHDCGLACISSILKFHNLNYGIDFLLDLIGDKEGYSLRDLIVIFKKMGIKTRPLELQENKTFEALKQIKLPCIALLEGEEYGHYITIYEIRNNYLLVSDPDKDKITKIKKEDFESKFTNFILEIDKESIPEKEKDQKKHSYFFKDILFRNKLIVFVILLTSLFVVGLAVAGSFYIKFLVDLIIPRSLRESLITITLIFISMVLIRCIFDFVRSYLIIKLSYKVDKEMSNVYFNKVTKLPINFFENREDGEVISRFNDGIYIKDFFSANFVTAIIDIILILGLGVILYRTNNILFLTIILPILLLSCLAILFFDHLKKKNQKLMEDKAKSTSLLINFLKNMTTVYSLNKTSFFLEKFHLTYDKQLNSTFSVAKAVISNEILKGLIQNSFTIIILWVGTRQVLNDSMSLGTLLFINTLAAFLLSSLDRILSMQSDLQQAHVASIRFFDVVNYPVQQDSNENLTELDFIQNIKTVNLNIGADPMRYIVEDINLILDRKDKVLIIGESGTGKSTFAKSLSKLYKVPDKSIYLNGLDINRYDHLSIRKRIVYIDENPFLFKGTIKENLCMGEIFDQNEIENACIMSQCHEFICNLDKQYSYKLSENGSNLSTGQKQRLALARAILHQPQVLILDESLSNIDPDNTKLIYETLHRMDCLIILITHNDPSNFKYNKKLVFRNNRIIESSYSENKEYSI
ncbi:peptidase domain-containing ABC transporter, partial [Bacillus subtilis]